MNHPSTTLRNIESNTPTGLPPADSDGGWIEGRDARHGRVNAGRSMGAGTHIPANFVNAAGGEVHALPQKSHDPAPSERLIGRQPADDDLCAVADGARVVTVGLRLAALPGLGVIDVPMIFRPVHSLPNRPGEQYDHG